MNHPELIVVPVLMLGDYALTILGAKSASSVYRRHFKTPHYELNPLWRESVARVRWFNPRHLVLVALVTALLVVVDGAAPSTPGPFELLLGMLFGAFGAVCGRHLTNLLLFRYVNRHPEELSGEVRLSMKLALAISKFSYVGWLPLLALVAVFEPGRYAVGVLLGVATLILAHYVWAVRRRSSPSPSPSPSPPG
jgi:hypothetical protein